MLPAAIVAFEWFHTHAPFGGVPLSMLAMSQSRAPLLPIAALGGSLLLGAAVAVLGVALHQAVADRRWQEPVAVLAVLAMLVGLGTWWPLGEPGPTVRIAAVQGGGPQGTRFSSDEAPLVYQRHLEATRGIDPAEDLDLVMWPENAINVDGVFLDGPWPAELAAEARRLDATVLVGVVEDAPGDPDRFVNYVVAIEPDGSIEARYDKVRRVPFGEYVPMRPLFEPIAEASLPPRDQIPGTGTAAIETSAGPMAVAVSWEVFFSRRVREGVRGGRRDRPQSDERLELLAHPDPDPAGRRLRAASRGERAMGGPGGSDRVLGDRRRLGVGAAADRHLRTGDRGGRRAAPQRNDPGAAARRSPGGADRRCGAAGRRPAPVACAAASAHRRADGRLLTPDSSEPGAI